MTEQRVGVVPEFTKGDRLRKARELMGLDQGDFADHIGTSRGTVSNYERGTTERYKPIVVRAWAMAAGVSLDWIETGIEPHGPTPGPGVSAQSDELARLTASKSSRTRGAAHNRQYGTAA